MARTSCHYKGNRVAFIITRFFKRIVLGNRTNSLKLYCPGMRIHFYFNYERSDCKDVECIENRMKILFSFYRISWNYYFLEFSSNSYKFNKDA